jgi:hypothetical protein
MFANDCSAAFASYMGESSTVSSYSLASSWGSGEGPSVPVSENSEMRVWVRATGNGMGSEGLS